MREAGARVERLIRSAMGTAGVRSVSMLARDARVQRATIYAWFAGAQEPSEDTAAKVGAEVGLTAAQIRDAWAGRGTPQALTPAAEAAVEEIVRRVIREELGALVAAAEARRAEDG